MSSKVRWTKKAEEDLDEIREYIAKNFTVDLAIEVVSEIVNDVEDILTDNPLYGTLLESNPLFSKIINRGNIIYYCENPEDRLLYVVYIQARKKLTQNSRINLAGIQKTTTK